MKYITYWVVNMTFTIVCGWISSSCASIKSIQIVMLVLVIIILLYYTCLPWSTLGFLFTNNLGLPTAMLESPWQAAGLVSLCAVVLHLYSIIKKTSIIYVICRLFWKYIALVPIHNFLWVFIMFSFMLIYTNIKHCAKLQYALLCIIIILFLCS